jgi:Ras-related GTP-binding protein C/D
LVPLSSLTHSSTLIPLEIWDCPGATTPADIEREAPLAHFAALVFVFDIQAAHDDQIGALAEWALAAARDPAGGPALDVFVHKSDHMADAHFRLGARAPPPSPPDRAPDAARDVPADPAAGRVRARRARGRRGRAAAARADVRAHERARLLRAPRLLTGRPARARQPPRARGAPQRLPRRPPPFPHAQRARAADARAQNSHASRVFLFDVHARIFLATDGAPVDAHTFGWCVEYLGLLAAFGRLYGWVPAPRCVLHAR